MKIQITTMQDAGQTVDVRVLFSGDQETIMDIEELLQHRMLPMTVRYGNGQGRIETIYHKYEQDWNFAIREAIHFYEKENSKGEVENVTRTPETRQEYKDAYLTAFEEED